MARNSQACNLACSWRARVRLSRRW
jgi:hypothetical protein